MRYEEQCVITFALFGTVKSIMLRLEVVTKYPPSHDHPMAHLNGRPMLPLRL